MQPWTCYCMRCTSKRIVRVSVLKNKGVFNCSGCHRLVSGPAVLPTWDRLEGDPRWDDVEIGIHVTAGESFWFREILDQEEWIQRGEESLEDDWPIGTSPTTSAEVARVSDELGQPEEPDILEVIRAQLTKLAVETANFELPIWVNDWVISNLRRLHESELITWFINDVIVLLAVFDENGIRPTRADFERTMMTLSSSAELLEPLASSSTVNSEQLVIGNQPLAVKRSRGNASEVAGSSASTPDAPDQEPLEDGPTPSTAPSVCHAPAETLSNRESDTDGEWRKYGIRPRAAIEWRRHGFTPSEAADWQEYFIEPRAARQWSDVGVGPEEASRRRDAARPDTN